ncbi:hypothetical protein RB614_25410 [Phytohabitans sp. ZYX-F-186]|uniref:Secreted protein n=1 Tax=Phytohabitans maris TaxID=3071409 RepID=A0ABU0ZMK3_9ACTN|nr:hypothetical protein [Phytohabitans sp. ZYX-F-186]MDQ7907866.1 hypothetical protein [Phytohabitans sp. ZYX-F-186]
MSATQIVVTVIVVLAVLAAAGAGWMLYRRWSLRHRFGPEYDRLVAERAGRSAAERELRERERRHAELDRRPLRPESRARYAAQWEEIQIRFVESPVEAVNAAEDLVGRMAAERGYPAGDFEEQAAYLSVEHARSLDHYRRAHAVREAVDRGESDTERLREALVHYREMVTELLGSEPIPTAARPEAEAHERIPAAERRETGGRYETSR